MAILLVWMEYRRANKRFLLVRIVAVLAAAVALACIILPVKYDADIAKTETHKTILLTGGFDEDSLPNGIDSTLITLDESIKNVYPKIKLISEVDELNKAGALHVYGNGLSEGELAQLNNLPLIFHPSKTPAGMIHISWNDKLKAGETLHIQGLYNNTSVTKVKLTLTGLNTDLDSIMVQPNAQTAFELSTIPKVTGKIVFSLKADTVIQGSLPVQIKPLTPLKILILSASPDFETKFLKNWLAQNGYSVALRSAISKGKYNTEFINMSSYNLDHLSAQALDKFDALIGDLSVFSALSNAETETLKTGVVDKGLGLIVRADSSAKAPWLQKQFPVDRPSGKEPTPAQITINGKKSNSSKLSYGKAYIIYENGTQPLVKVKERVLAGSILYGEGKLISTTLNNTFTWALNGNNNDYASLWSALISKAARKSTEVENDIQFANLPVVNKPVVLQLSQGNPSSISINNQWVAPAQNPDVPFEWGLTYQPTSAGWQNLKIGSKLINWFAYNNNDWKTLRSVEKTRATAKYAAMHPNTSFVTKQIHQKIRIEVPKRYFYILLLAACTFLWIETKLP